MSRLLLIFGVGIGLLALATPAAAQDCSCDNSDFSLCNPQGFRISLINFQVDANAGTSSWDYQVCNETGLGTGCDAPKDLSHIDLDLPSLGTCLTSSQQVTLGQVAGFANAVLACGVSDKDPSCDIDGTVGLDFVAKCDVAGGNLDSGECVVMRLSIAGELPTLGPGAAMTVTKAGRDCVSACIQGPSCNPCVQPPDDACLTRTAGFWGTHPHIADDFLPVTVCGHDLNQTAAGSCDSATEALCVSGGRESRSNPPYTQLVRQLTAAKLNLAASAANGGTCGAEIEARIAECEGLCGASKQVISASGCIEDLDAFNNSQDTVPSTPAPFDSPGPAQPGDCQSANGNGVVIGLNACF